MPVRPMDEMHGDFMRDLRATVRRPHPWNSDPPPRYRLIVVHRRKPDNELVAISVSREALSRLEGELAALDYDLIRLERLN